MRRRTWIYLGLGGLVVLLMLGSLRLISGGDFIRTYPISVGSFATVRSYRIDPHTLLRSLQSDGQHLYQPASEMSMERVTALPVYWSQADFTEVANDVAKFAWNESLASWHVYRVVFETRCSDHLEGFEQAELTYFKPVSVNGQDVYDARAIVIAPAYGDITLGSNTTFPRPLFGWREILLDSVVLSADQALRAADAKGGQTARNTLQNQCKIYVSMNPEAYGHKDWRVSYSSNGKVGDYETIIRATK